MSSNPLAPLAIEAQSIDAIASAAIFITRPGSDELELRAAAGIDGQALAGLEAAVRDPSHPVARALHDSSPTYDVKPMNPGGPALRSHLPLDGLGVLAVSHDRPLTADARVRLEAVADSAMSALRGDR